MDIWVANNIILWRHPWLDIVMIAVTYIGSPASLSAVMAVIAYFFYKRGKVIFVRLIVFTMAGGLAIVEGLKYLIARPRPAGGLINVSGYSFPSAHAAIATIFILLLVYSHARKPGTLLATIAIIVVAVVAVALIGFSRVYLGVHWLSDILAGYAIGSLWVLLVVALNRFFICRNRRIQKNT